MDFIESVFSGKSRHGPFYKPACRILRSLEKRERKKGTEPQKGLEVLTGIYGIAQGKKWYQEYRILKWEKTLTFLTAGFGLAGLLGLQTFAQSHGEGIDRLERPDSGAGSQTYELNAKLGETVLEGLVVEVPERQLSQSECRQLLKDAEAELNEQLEKSGYDFDAVSADLSLPDTLQKGLVEVSWSSSNYRIMDSAGHVRNELVEETGELLMLEAKLSCMEEEKILTFPVRVVPAGTDAASRLQREAARKIAEEETEAESSVFILPDEYDGQKISWQLAEPAWGLWIAGLTLTGSIALQAAFEQDLIRQGEKRREQLLAEYPSFLARLTLLAGTGMPIRMVFVRLAKEGDKADSAPVYQEVLKTVREMESGLTELQAYENFGRRCRLPQYRKCASLLVQNVRRGTGDLLGALNREAENAFEERKALARKKGEEAQTRLLLPMLMMLVVVMILIMVPACFSFGGL